MKTELFPGLGASRGKDLEIDIRGWNSDTWIIIGFIYNYLAILYAAVDKHYQNPTPRPGLFQSWGVRLVSLAQCNGLCSRGWPQGHESQVVLQLKIAVTKVKRSRSFSSFQALSRSSCSICISGVLQIYSTPEIMLLTNLLFSLYHCASTNLLLSRYNVIN